MKTIGEHELLIFLLQACVLLVTARALGGLFRRWRQPPVVGELCAGLFLGPTLLGNISPRSFLWLFPPASPHPEMLEGMAWLGVVLLLLVAGMETNVSAVRRRGRPAVLTSLVGAIVPFLTGVLLGLAMPQSYVAAPGPRLVFCLFLGTAMSISALPVIARILMDLNLLKSDLGRIIISAALLEDLLGWIIFSIVLGLMSGAGVHIPGLVMLIILTLGFALFCFTVGRWVIDGLLRWTQIVTPRPAGAVTVALGVTLLCSAVTQWIGIHAILGAFLAGVMLGDSPHLKARAKETIGEYGAGVFAPVFFATVGLEVDLFHSFNPALILVFLAVACIGKLVGSYAGARWGGMVREEALCVSFGMNARGAMEIILALVAFQHHLIGEEIFVALLVVAVVTSMMAGPMMKWSLRKRPDITIT